MVNRSVLRARRNECSVDAEVTVDGRLFHALAAETKNAQARYDHIAWWQHSELTAWGAIISATTILATTRRYRPQLKTISATRKIHIGHETYDEFITFNY